MQKQPLFGDYPYLNITGIKQLIKQLIPLLFEQGFRFNINLVPAFLECGISTGCYQKIHQIQLRITDNLDFRYLSNLFTHQFKNRTAKVTRNMEILYRCLERLCEKLGIQALRA